MELLTERFRIRPLAETDYPAFEQTLNDVQRTCLGSGRAFFDWIVAQYARMDIAGGLVSLGVFDRRTGRLVGTAGAGRHDDLHEPEIFYYILPEYRNQGYATEAAKAITRWACESYPIPYLIGTAAVDNPASQRVLEKSGFQLIDERELLVHVKGERYIFKYYRYYPEKSAEESPCIAQNP